MTKEKCELLSPHLVEDTLESRGMLSVIDPGGLWRPASRIPRSTSVQMETDLENV